MEKIKLKIKLLAKRNVLYSDGRVTAFGTLYDAKEGICLFPYIPMEFHRGELIEMGMFGRSRLRDISDGTISVTLTECDGAKRPDCWVERTPGKTHQLFFRGHLGAKGIECCASEMKRIGMHVKPGRRSEGKGIRYFKIAMRRDS